jgi:hypothetical protein
MKEDEQTKSGSMISRRKMLASLGAAGAVLVTGNLLESTSGIAYAKKESEDGIIVTTIVQLRANTTPVSDKIYYVTDLGQEGPFRFDSADTTTADNTGLVLVSSNGKRFKRIYDEGKGAEASWFGAKADNVTDDTAALQLGINSARILNLKSAANYRTTSTLSIHKHLFILNGNRANIHYYGTEFALEGTPIGIVFPVAVTITELAIIVWISGAKGFNCKFSYSRFTNLDIVLRQNNQTAMELVGDVNGTGCYYNLFENFYALGLSKTGTYGVKFVYDPSTPSRCPNANTFIGGRVGQVENAWLINGNKNRIISPTCEGITGVTFNIGNPDSIYGCVDIEIQGLYQEGAEGLTVFKVQPNVYRTVINNPYITSIGTTGTDLVDEGIDTQYWYSGAKIKFSTEGLQLNMPSSTMKPVVYGAYPGWDLTDSANNVTLRIQNGSNFSEGTEFVGFYDQTGSRYIAQLGTVTSQMHAYNLLLQNGLVGIYSGTGSPEGVVTANNGSVYYRTDGSQGTAMYIKETGSGTTGWIRVQTVPAYTAVASNTTLNASDGNIDVDASSGPVTIVLPPANVKSSSLVTIKKIDASTNAVTVVAGGTDTIDGGTSAVIGVKNECISLMSNGSASHTVRSWYKP